MAEDSGYTRISENVLLFDDGLLGYDFDFFDYLAYDMFDSDGRFQYHHQVNLLLKIFEAIMDVVRTERWDETWLQNAQLRLDTCKRVLHDFPENGDFTQWRKLTYNEHRVLNLMLDILHVHEDVALRPTIREAHRAWSEWRGTHRSFYDSDRADRADQADRHIH